MTEKFLDLLEAAEFAAKMIFLLAIYPQKVRLPALMYLQGELVKNGTGKNLEKSLEKYPPSSIFLLKVIYNRILENML